jgi:hypothetical protein
MPVKPQAALALVAPNSSAAIESSASALPEIRLGNGASRRSRLTLFMTEFMVFLSSFPALREQSGPSVHHDRFRGNTCAANYSSPCNSFRSN